MSVASQSARPVGAGQVAEADFDFPALGSALWRKKWRILLPTLLAALAALAVVQVITPRYLSEARLIVEARDNVYLRPDADKDLVARNVVDDEAVVSQVQLILSRDLARDVIAKLKLNERAEFDPTLGHISPIKRLLGMVGLIRDPMSMTAEERVLEAYYERLNVYPVEKSRVIVIDFVSQDPDLAAQVANAIAEAYLMRQSVAKQEQAQAAVRWLSGEIEAMQRKVAEAEARVEGFRARSNLLVGPNGITLSAQQLGDFNAQLAAARGQKAEAEAKAHMIRDMLRSGAPIESSDILNSELIRRLSEQRVTLRAQLAEQSSTLLDGHPRIRELKAQIADLEKQIRVEAEAIARSFENDAKLAAARVDSLTVSFDQIKNQAATVNERDVELRALERDAKSQRDLLESYLAKYREATARDTINSSPADARVISRATASNIQAYPKKLSTVIIAAVATFLLCGGFVGTRELLSAPTPVRARAVAVAAPLTPGAAPTAVFSSAPAAVAATPPAATFTPAAPPPASAPPPLSDTTSLTQRMAGVLSRNTGARKSAATSAAATPVEPAAFSIMPEATASTDAEEAVASAELSTPGAANAGPASRSAVAVPIGAIADIAYSLRAAGTGKRVAVLGARQGIDSGDTAIKLARALVENGRVVLVGLECGDPAIKNIALEPEASGLAELAGGLASFRDIITKDRGSPVHLISAGRSPVDRFTLLSSPALARGFEALVRSYDYVVLDAGVAEGADLAVIGEIAPHAVLLAETPANLATAAARERLHAANFADVTLLTGARAGAPAKAVAA